ncbi:hypothetical protein E2562_027112 [Oryza meyeriana var. granulata]|uniref:Uncharacterized protein n=1 Tax=Oryza meyeriana var. granulata TaxID=110450 RepID=A0A6G1EPX5_9ORYZ|nr:hypothetical protein E2562_027112 [Oryza meyeriana var. granulata]
MAGAAADRGSREGAGGLTRRQRARSSRQTATRQGRGSLGFLGMAVGKRQAKRGARHGWMR